MSEGKETTSETNQFKVCWEMESMLYRYHNHSCECHSIYSVMSRRVMKACRILYFSTRISFITTRTDVIIARKDTLF